jgi:CRP/FNR family cyclic AMP-dependent transcriptional regulator
MAQDAKRPAVGERTMALKAVPFFQQLSDKELDVVRSVAVEKTYAKNAVVLNEGDVRHALMIQAGKVKVIGDEDGREITLKLLGPGAFFGELSMIDKQARSASVTTTEPSTFLVLSHAAFERCIEKAPTIANMVMQMLAQRVREADRKIGTLALMDVYGRVASTLLELSVYSNGKLMVSEKLSQQDLANMVGASREMVNRILKDLDRGFISIESKSRSPSSTESFRHRCEATVPAFTRARGARDARSRLDPPPPRTLPRARPRKLQPFRSGPVVSGSGRRSPTRAAIGAWSPTPLLPLRPSAWWWVARRFGILRSTAAETLGEASGAVAVSLVGFAVLARERTLEAMRLAISRSRMAVSHAGGALGTCSRPIQAAFDSPAPR